MNAEERKNAELVERFMRGAGVHESFWAETPFPKLQRYLISLGMPSDDVNDAGTKDELLLLIAKFAVFENGVMVIQGAVGATKIRREAKARIEKEDAATEVLSAGVKGRAARNDVAQKDAAAQQVQGLMSGTAV